MEHAERFDNAVRMLVNQCLDAVSTTGQQRESINHRAVASQMHKFLFDTMMKTSGSPAQAWQDGMATVMNLCLEMENRVSNYQSFVRTYQETMLEITSYGMPPLETDMMRTRIIDLIEDEIGKRMERGPLIPPQPAYTPDT